MSGERLLGSYIVRVTVSEGRPRIAVLDVGTGETALLDSYQELTRHLEQSQPNYSRPGEPRKARHGGSK